MRSFSSSTEAFESPITAPNFKLNGCAKFAFHGHGQVVFSKVPAATLQTPPLGKRIVTH